MSNLNDDDAGYRVVLRAQINNELANVKIYQSLDLPDFRSSGKRKRTDARLESILKCLDPAGMQILDLGCSNGYFCYELAKRGGKVTGVDKNEPVLALNRKIAAYYGWNAQFQDAFLDIAFFNNLPRYDAILFLSVIHHIFNNTSRQPIEMCRNIVSILAGKTDLLIFEIGQSGEPFGWSRKLALMEPNPKQWILQNLFEDSGFTKVEVIDPPAFTKGALAPLRRRIWDINRRWTVLPPRHYLRKAIAHLLVKLFIYDPRDTRYIFVARK
jgi:SAM-dependent methyltransferase